MILPVHRHLLTPIFLRGIDKSMKQRTLLIIVLVLMVVLVVVLGTFFSSVLSFWQGADGSVATPTATPTELPSPNDPPIPTPTQSPSSTPPPLDSDSVDH